MTTCLRVVAVPSIGNSKTGSMVIGEQSVVLSERCALHSTRRRTVAEIEVLQRR